MSLIGSLAHQSIPSCIASDWPECCRKGKKGWVSFFLCIICTHNKNAHYITWLGYSINIFITSWLTTAMTPFTVPRVSQRFACFFIWLMSHCISTAQNLNLKFEQHWEVTQRHTSTVTSPPAVIQVSPEGLDCFWLTGFISQLPQISDVATFWATTHITCALSG